MTVSFLFILMVLLAFFASQFDDASEKVPKAWLDEARVKLEDAQKQIDVLQDEIAALRAENTRLRAEVETANAKIGKLEAEIERLQEMIRRLEVRDPLEAYISQGSEARRRILEALRDQLKLRFPELQVVISEESDALRFQGDGLFDRGQALLQPAKRGIVDLVAEELELILPCYTLGAAASWSRECNPAGAIIEALQIEGHTDSDGDAISNLRLSTARANETFVVMTAREPGLVAYLNMRDQPVISVAGYGEMRPVAQNDTPASKATNRRIDIRIIMYVPRGSDEIDRIRERLAARLPETRP
ncbi:OmpA family protein [Amaricoccus solimangrovi]|nr:OmpA family protein [Amaricoccus solimangrovi]